MTESDASPRSDDLLIPTERDYLATARRDWMGLVAHRARWVLWGTAIAVSTSLLTLLADGEPFGWRAIAFRVAVSVALVAGVSMCVFCWSWLVAAPRRRAREGALELQRRAMQRRRPLTLEEARCDVRTVVARALLELEHRLDLDTWVAVVDDYGAVRGYHGVTEDDLAWFEAWDARARALVEFAVLDLSNHAPPRYPLPVRDLRRERVPLRFFAWERYLRRDLLPAIDDLPVRRSFDVSSERWGAWAIAGDHEPPR